MNGTFVFIAPYEEMAIMAREVARELNMNDWVFDVGYGEEGLALARRYSAQGARIIVSRNMTALAISRHLDIPVIDLSASPYDIVDGLSNARRFGAHIGVMGPAELVYGCQSLGEPMGISVSELMITDLNQLPQAIQEAKKQGIEVILGGQNEIQCAISYGLIGILLYTNKSTIAAAMKKAVELYQLQYAEKLRSEQIRTVLDNSYEGIIATNPAGNIIIMNLTARTMLNKGKDVLGLPLKEVLPFLPEHLLYPAQDSYSAGTVSLQNDRLILHSRGVTVDGSAGGIVLSLQYVKDMAEMEHKLRREIVMKGHIASTSFDQVTTCSDIMQQIIDQARRYALTDSTILITGETGTGKEMFAQSIHNASRRNTGPFVAINCASIPENLLESELFGYDEGSFTGARRNGKKGYFELANGGTLFLDEIGEIPLKLQANLLRVLQEKQIMRIGGDRVIPINVRIIAATHRDLQQAVEQEKFRLDLFYRLNVLRLVIPPLRNRPADIPLLVASLIRRKSKELDLPPIEIDPELMTFFSEYPWYGNVRELENAIERLCIVCNGGYVGLRQVRQVLVEFDFQKSPEQQRQDLLSLREAEKQRITEALLSARWHRAEAAKLLGISTTTLWRKIKTYGIDVPINGKTDA